MDVNLDDLRLNHKEDFKPSGKKPSNIWKPLFLIVALACVALAAWVITGGHADALFGSNDINSDTPGPNGKNTKNAPPGDDEKKNPQTPPPPASGKGFSTGGWVKLPNDFPVVVTSLVEGRIDEITVIEGDDVKKGQVIARLYDKDLRDALDVARAELELANASYLKMTAGFRTQEKEEACAEVDRLKAEMLAAKAVYENSRKLPEGAIPRDQLLRDKAAFEAANSALVKAEKKYDLVCEGFRSEDVAHAAAALAKAAATLKIAERKLSYVEIKSPIDGRVLKRAAREGQWIKPQETIATLYDPAKLEARLDVDLDDRGKVFVGQKVEITTRVERGRRFSGTVVLIEPQADERKNTVPVKVRFDNPEKGILHPDMIIEARFLDSDK